MAWKRQRAGSLERSGRLSVGEAGRGGRRRVPQACWRLGGGSIQGHRDRGKDRVGALGTECQDDRLWCCPGGWRRGWVCVVGRSDRGVTATPAHVPTLLPHLPPTPPPATPRTLIPSLWPLPSGLSPSPTPPPAPPTRRGPAGEHPCDLWVPRPHACSLLLL